MGVTTNERNGPSTNNCSLTMSIQCTCLACSAFRSKINLEFIYNEKLLCTKYYTLNNPYQKCPSPPNWTKNKGTLLKQKLQDRNSIKMAREWFKGPIFFGFPIPVYTAIRRQHISVLYHEKLPLAQRCKKGLLPLVWDLLWPKCQIGSWEEIAQSVCIEDTYWMIFFLYICTMCQLLVEVMMYTIYHTWRWLVYLFIICFP